jgi:hypothetical protein
MLPPNKVPPEGEWQAAFSIKLKPNLPIGTRINNQADIVFDFNPSILTPLITHIIGAPLISSSKKTLNFGQTELNQTLTEKVWLKNIGDIPLKLENIPNPNNQFRIVEDNCSGKLIQPKDSLLLILEFTPDSSAYFIDTMYVPSSDLSNYPYEIIMTGYGPGVSVSESQLDSSEKIIYWCVPNPFEEQTKIFYILCSSNNVTIDIYNSLGERITTLVDEWNEAGSHIATFETGNLPQGMYFYTIRIGERIESGKLILVR